MLSIAKCRDLGYYEREVIDGREDYLSESGTSPGRWVGSLAAADGFAGPAKREDLAAAFAGFHPNGPPMTEFKTTTAGFDLTLSPSKSVSLVWALGSPQDATEVEAALYAARDEVERYLESRACFVRRGHAGAFVEPGAGFMGAVFQHRTSRLGDPGIHLHWTVFNWGWHGLTDIHQVGRVPRKDVQNGDRGEEQAPSPPVVHAGVQGRDRWALPRR